MASMNPPLAVKPNIAPVFSPHIQWQDLAQRLGLVVTGAYLFRMALQAWQLGQIGTHHPIVWFIFAEYVLAFALLISSCLPAGAVRRAIALVPIAIVLSLCVWFYIKIEINAPFYGTDNAAFSHVAAERLLDGENPYAVNDGSAVQEAGERFGVPKTFITSTTDGQPLENLMSWPAGSILAVAPALAVGINDVRWVVVGFEILVLAMLWLCAPSAVRPLAVVALLIDQDLALDFTGGGVMDFIWVAPVLGCAILLNRGNLGYAALLLGIAAGTKQQPWLLAPFLAIWVWYAKEDLPVRVRVGAIARFAAISMSGFLALNLPFMIWGFSDWLNGILVPFNEQLVPFGSGLSLLTQTGIVALPKSFYSLATFGVWAVLLLAYAVHFRTLRHAVWLAPAIIMWFGYRSLQNYFIYWTPMMLIGVMAWWDEEQHRLRGTTKSP